LEFSQVMIPALPLELTLGKALVLCGMACSGINPDFNEYDKALYSGNTLSKVRIGGEVLGVPPNFYCINVAESGSGKDIGGLFNQLVYANRWGCSAGSPEGVADILTTKEVACLTISEMQNFFDAKRWEHKLNSFMTELFNQYRFEVALSKRGETGQRRSDYCVMNILGSIQPEIIKSLANKNLLESGFLGRCLFFNSPVHYGVPNENLINNTENLQIILNFLSKIQGRFNFNQELVHAKIKQYENKGHRSLWRRLFNETAKKIAFLLSINNNSFAINKITDDAVIDSLTICEWIYQNSCLIFDDAEKDHQEKRFDSICNKVLSWFNDNEEKTRSDIYHKYRPYTKDFLLDEILNCLIIDRKIAYREEKTGNKPKKIYKKIK